MLDTANRLDQQLSQLRESFAARLPGRVEEIVGAWKAIAENGWNAENGKRFHRLIHSLSGAAATFGFAALSQAARELELYVEPLLTAVVPPAPEQNATIAAWLQTLQEPRLREPSALIANASPSIAPPEPMPSHCLFLVTQGDALSELSAQMEYFDYKIQRVSSLEQLPQELKCAVPVAILIDADVFPSDRMLDHLNAVHSTFAKNIPIIFISAHGDLAARLASVRAGADAYFAKPVKVSRLVDKLDQLTSAHAPDPYRILVVEDDEAMAQFYAMTLQQSGMETNIISDPNFVLKQLMDWKPDLILMDLYMPYCSGVELASVIRQQEDYVSIPIVYLSAETRVEKQLAALSRGGDDFLTKPIKPEHLIASVTARAERSHALRSLILRDSLTGLFNHTAIKGHLEREIARAHRNHLPLAYAMLDIDHFKHVNDSYGHPTGDGVLKTLARLLQQRLRKTDIVGRYGGEEFAVILPEAEALQARNVLDEIRARFSQIRQQSGNTEFEVTFSAGIAVFPEYEQAKSLNDAADRSLYLAKQNGRNRVILAQN